MCIEHFWKDTKNSRNRDGRLRQRNWWLGWERNWWLGWGRRETHLTLFCTVELLVHIHVFFGQIGTTFNAKYIILLGCMWVGSMKRSRISSESQCVSPQIFINDEGKNSNSTVGKIGGTHLNRVIKVEIDSNGAN